MSNVRPRGNSFRLGLFLHSDVDDAGLSVYEFRVYAHLCRRANDEQRVWEGQAKIAATCGMSRKKVNEVLQSLEEKGWIRQIERRREDNSRTTNDIFLLGIPVTKDHTPVTDGYNPRASELQGLSTTVTAEGNPVEGNPREEETSSAHADTDAKRGESEESPAFLLLALWNEHKGTLPKATLTTKRQKRLEAIAREMGVSAAREVFHLAVLEVASDPFWQQKKYGLDNLLAGDKYVGKAESYLAKHPRNLRLEPPTPRTPEQTAALNPFLFAEEA